MLDCGGVDGHSAPGAAHRALRYEATGRNGFGVVSDIQGHCSALCWGEGTDDGVRNRRGKLPVYRNRLAGRDRCARQPGILVGERRSQLDVLTPERSYFAARGREILSKPEKCHTEPCGASLTTSVSRSAHRIGHRRRTRAALRVAYVSLRNGGHHAARPSGACVCPSSIALVDIGEPAADAASRCRAGSAGCNRRDDHQRRH